MDIRAVFGGCEIIVPSHWDVKNEMFVALGSVEDERVIRMTGTDQKRTQLILRGTCVFGGVDIKSF